MASAQRLGSGVARKWGQVTVRPGTLGATWWQRGIGWRARGQETRLASPRPCRRRQRPVTSVAFRIDLQQNGALDVSRRVRRLDAYTSQASSHHKSRPNQMKFNSYAWDLYRNSDRGRAAIDRFSTLTSDFVDPDLRIYDVAVSDEFKDEFIEETQAFDIAELVREAMVDPAAPTTESATDRFLRLHEEGIPMKMLTKEGQAETICYFGESDDEWYNLIGAISLGLHFAYPDQFLPYDFRCRFHQLEELHQVFSIPLPPIPGKQQHEERARYYLDINSAWQEFRVLHGLSPQEMSAFLYDFAPNFITPLTAADLPNPTKVWMITGGSWDIDAADAATAETVTRWGANANVRRGDILLLYLVSPRSAIHSIWRACSRGFVDPFFHYHSAAWMCAPTKIPEISIAELRNHPLLSLKPSVKANFKGPSGKAPVSVEEYDAMLSLAEAKGASMADLPRLPILPKIDFGEITSERDVELEIVEPFLLRLGYKSKDWIRQMPVRMGRGERNYPDYAFGAVSKRGEESAKMLIETKLQLTSRREFVEAFLQAKSYALRLQCKILALAAQEGIWVFPLHDGRFDIDQYRHKAWGALDRSDDYHEIANLIGRENILGRHVSER